MPNQMPEKSPVPTPNLPPLAALRAQRRGESLFRAELEGLLRHPTPTRVGWLLDVARAEMTLGLADEAAERLGVTISQAFRRNDVEGLAEAWRLQVDQLLTLGNYASARDLVGQIEWLSASRDNPAQWARHAESLGWWLLRSGGLDSGEYTRSLDAFERARALYEECGDGFGLLRAYDGLANASSALGYYMVAIEHADRGLKLSATMGDWRLAHRLLTGRAFALRDQGYRHPAWDAFDLAVAWGDESGDQVGTARALFGLGVLLGYRTYEEHGEAEPALDHLHRALALASAGGAAPLMMEIHLAIADLRMVAGDVLAAREAREAAARAVGPISPEDAPSLLDRREREREVIERSRKDREARRIREAVESSPDALFVFDACYHTQQGITDMLNEFRNAAADALIESDPLQVRLLSDLARTPLFADLGEVLPAVVAANRPYADEVEIEREGRMRRFARRAVPMTDGVALTIQDLAHRLVGDRPRSLA